MVGLSTMSYAGEGVKKDNAEAVKWAIVACFKSKESWHCVKEMMRWI